MGLSFIGPRRPTTLLSLGYAFEQARRSIDLDLGDVELRQVGALAFCTQMPSMVLSSAPSVASGVTTLRPAVLLSVTSFPSFALCRR